MTQEEDNNRKYSNEVKKHFLEIVSTYNKYQEMMDRKSDITEVAETLGGITEAARTLAIHEGDDWFDKHTVKRNMSELDKLGKQFDKVAVEAKGLDQRMAGLYEDMGHILSRYYKIGEITEDQMKERLGMNESKEDCGCGCNGTTEGGCNESVNEAAITYGIEYKSSKKDRKFKKASLTKTTHNPNIDKMMIKAISKDAKSLAKQDGWVDYRITKDGVPVKESDLKKLLQVVKNTKYPAAIDESKQVFKKGSEKITANVDKSGDTPIVTYKTNNVESLSQDLLLQMKKDIGGDFILKTNAGVDVHSMHKGNWKGITLKRLNEAKSFKVNMFGPKMATKQIQDVKDFIYKKLGMNWVFKTSYSPTFDESNRKKKIDKQIEKQWDVNSRIINFKIDESTINEAKKLPTKQEIIKYLIKKGNNPNDAKKMVDKQYDHVISAWKNASLPHMADVVRTLGMDEQFEATMNENFSDTDIEKIKQIITKQKKLIGLTPHLKKAGFKNIDFVMIDSVPPHIKIKQGNKTFLIVNKKYVDKPDFVIGDIAGGLDEGKYIEEGAMSDIDIIRQESPNLAVFVKSTLKAYPKLGKSKNTLKWLKDIYDDKMTEAAHGYEDSDASYITKHKGEFKLAQKLVKKSGKDEMKFYDELESIHEKIGHPKYMMWLSAALRGYKVDMHKDSKIKNRAEAEEALFLLSK